MKILSLEKSIFKILVTSSALITGCSDYQGAIRPTKSNSAIKALSTTDSSSTWEDVFDDTTNGGTTTVNQSGTPIAAEPTPTGTPIDNSQPPVASEPPPTSERPVASEPPVVNPPIASEPPVVNPPIATEPPAVIPPIVMEPPPTSEPPAANEPPVVNPPIASEPPVVNPPIATEPPAVIPPIVMEPPTTSEPPAASEPPVVNPPIASEPPVVNPPIATEPPAVIPPIVMEPPTTSEPPIAVKPPVTSQPPVMIDPKQPGLPPDLKNPIDSCSPVAQNQCDSKSYSNRCGDDGFDDSTDLDDANECISFRGLNITKGFYGHRMPTLSQNKKTVWFTDGSIKEPIQGHGKLVLIYNGKKGYGTIAKIDGWKGKIILCGFIVEEMKRLRGKVVLVNSGVKRLEYSRGRVVAHQATFIKGKYQLNSSSISGGLLNPGVFSIINNKVQILGDWKEMSTDSVKMKSELARLQQSISIDHKSATSEIEQVLSKLHKDGTIKHSSSINDLKNKSYEIKSLIRQVLNIKIGFETDDDDHDCDRNGKKLYTIDLFKRWKEYAEHAKKRIHECKASAHTLEAVLKVKEVKPKEHTGHNLTPIKQITSLSNNKSEPPKKDLSKNSVASHKGGSCSKK